MRTPACRFTFAKAFRRCRRFARTWENGVWPDFPAGPASHSGGGWISGTEANRRKPSVHPARKGLKAGATAERRHQGGKYGREIRDGRQQAHMSFGHTGILGRRSETGSGRCPRQTECRAQVEMHRWLFREEIKRPRGQGGQQENERDAVLPRRHAMGDGTVCRPDEGTGHRHAVAKGIVFHVGENAGDVRSRFTAQYPADAGYGQRQPRNERPAGLLAVEKYGEQNREAGSQIIYHADFDGLPAVLRETERQRQRIS